MFNDDEYETILFDIVEFLAEYEKLPSLWDRTHPDHRNLVISEDNHTTLGEKVGIYDLNMLKKKIRNIRGSYNTEIRKIKASLKSGVGVYEPKLFWFPLADRFLRVTTDLSVEEFPIKKFEDKIRVMKKTILQKLPKEHRVTIAPYKKRRKSRESDSDTVIEYEEIEFIEEQNVNNEEIPPVDVDVDGQRLETDSMTDATEKEGAETIDSVIDFIKTLANAPENEFATFGKWVGLQLQNLPLEKALQLQIDIQSHIMKTRLNHLKQTNDDHT